MTHVEFEGGGVTQHTQKTKNAQNGLKMTPVDFHHVKLPPPHPQHVHIQMCTHRLMVITLNVW